MIRKGGVTEIARISLTTPFLNTITQGGGGGGGGVHVKNKIKLLFHSYVH